jgi:hypothetical protein
MKDFGFSVVIQGQEGCTTVTIVEHAPDYGAAKIQLLVQCKMLSWDVLGFELKGEVSWVQ